MKQQRKLPKHGEGAKGYPAQMLRPLQLLNLPNQHNPPNHNNLDSRFTLWFFCYINMDLSKLATNVAKSGDPGAYIKQELEEGLEPITKRVDALEKKLDQLISLCTRIENLLKAMKPIVDLIQKIPFIK